MKIIHIDTTNNKEINLSLTIEGKVYEVKRIVGARESQTILPMIEEMLKEHELKITELTGISVNVGPGSFTGIRVGVAIANTLGTFLQIPINNMPIGHLVEPIYA